MSSDNVWLWDHRLLAVVTALEIPWKNMGRSLTKEELGSSFGDVAWDGARLLIEPYAPDEWVAHDIGHWLVCQYMTPHLAHHKNWGLGDDREEPDADFDIPLGNIFAPTGEFDADTETFASAVGVAVLIRAGLPWFNNAVYLNVLDEFRTGWYAPRTRDTIPGTPIENQIRARILDTTADFFPPQYPHK